MARRRALGVIRFTRAGLPNVSTAPDSMRQQGATRDVTVVIATYNRSNVLRFTLEALIRQTLTDWEALVIGDHCTDDSGRVVESFGDPRLKWWNLPTNLGDQSGPNSVGARLARGRYIAWLNHDDLWFPDHLERLLDGAQAQSAGFVASGWLNVGPRPGATGGGMELVAEQWNPVSRQRIHMADVYPASTWLVRRDLVSRIGDWRSFAQLRAAPSQDYVFRCWASGARMRLGGRPSVVAIQSARFPGAYADRRVAEHEHLAPAVARMTPEALAADLKAELPLSQLPLSERIRVARGGRDLPFALAREGVMATAVPLAARLGVGPAEFKARLRGVAPGAWKAELTALRGIER